MHITVNVDEKQTESGHDAEIIYQVVNGETVGGYFTRPVGASGSFSVTLLLSL